MPLTDEFPDLPIDSIYWDERYRKDLGDLSSFAEGIRQKGMMHPPLIRKRDGRGVSGQRRVEACKRHLGWTAITCRLYDDEGLTEEEAEAEILEYETAENWQRKDTTWQENAEAVARYHELRKTQNPGWTERQTAERIGLKQQTVNDYLKVSRHKQRPEVWDAPAIQQAVRTAVRIEERARERETEWLRGGAATLPATGVYISDSLPATGVCTSDSIANPRHSFEGHSIIHADFQEWAPSHDGPKFNFIHCDFPYGDESHDLGQGARHLGHYDDSPEVYLSCCEALERNHRICAGSAHIMFWCSTDRYTEAAEFVKQLGFKIDGPPLIWLKHGTGNVPDAQRRPRRVYEWAIFGWRGDRKLTARGVKDNAIEVPLPRETDRIHKHQKPLEMLTHFFEMIVDENTRMLDPTCGSGTSIRAAMALGAAATLGIEREEEFAEDARRALAKFGEDSYNGLTPVDLSALGLA
jgi:ParB family transcriptional regulator, chromosome partitioning protein